MARKIRVGILFGGKSVEHEVSLRSAQNVVAALDRHKYEPVLIGIDKQGRWQRGEELFLTAAKNDMNTRASKRTEKHVKGELTFSPERKGELVALDTQDGASTQAIDVVFPILHGPLGEDGTVQGLLKLAGIPFVGSGVLGSAIGMDKDVMKRLLREAGLPVAPFLVFRRGEPISYALAAKKLGKTLFVKPANAGSSVGVSKAKDGASFKRAVALAFQFDNKILVEKALAAREIECAVLGNDKLLVAIPGEVIPNHEFYSYEAKYLDENGARIEIPARLTKAQVAVVQSLAKQVFQTLECAGLARVDFFLTRQGKWYVNEINTIPGFTSISMYPKMFEASGIDYAKLIDGLLTLALERFESDQHLQTSRV